MKLEDVLQTRRGKSMISLVNNGNFNNTNKFLQKALTSSKVDQLDKFGKQGVKALMAATPKDSGETAKAWSYDIKRLPGHTILTFYNSHMEEGVNIAIILQYGHGTRQKGWVEGIDYINPAMKPIFNNILESAWREVTK